MHISGLIVCNSIEPLAADERLDPDALPRGKLRHDIRIRRGATAQSRAVALHIRAAAAGGVHKKIILTNIAYRTVMQNAIPCAVLAQHFHSRSARHFRKNRGIRVRAFAQVHLVRSDLPHLRPFGFSFSLRRRAACRHCQEGKHQGDRS